MRTNYLYEINNSYALENLRKVDRSLPSLIPKYIARQKMNEKMKNFKMKVLNGRFFLPGSVAKTYKQEIIEQILLKTLKYSP